MTIVQCDVDCQICPTSQACRQELDGERVITENYFAEGRSSFLLAPMWVVVHLVGQNGDLLLTHLLLEGSNLLLCFVQFALHLQ